MSHILINTWYFLSLISHGYEVAPLHCGFNLHFPDQSWAWGPFHILITGQLINELDSVQCLFTSFVLFSTRCPLFLTERSAWCKSFWWTHMLSPTLPRGCQYTLSETSEVSLIILLWTWKLVQPIWKTVEQFPFHSVKNTFVSAPKHMTKKCLKCHLKWPRPGNSSHQKNGEINHTVFIQRNMTQQWASMVYSCTHNMHEFHKQQLNMPGDTRDTWHGSKNEPGKSHPRCFVSGRRLPLGRTRRQLWVVPCFWSGPVSTLRKPIKPYLVCVCLSGCVVSIKS